MSDAPGTDSPQDQPEETAPTPEPSPAQEPQAQVEADTTQEQQSASPQSETPEPSESKGISRSSKSGGFHWGVGRRKTSVARVRIRPGSGTFLINKREIENYFTEPGDQSRVVSPLQASGAQGSVDVFVTVRGGGYSGQAGAVLLGVARALVKADAALDRSFKQQGFLTRDDRKKERKKPGQPGARKRFQYSKR